MDNNYSNNNSNYESQNNNFQSTNLNNQNNLSLNSQNNGFNNQHTNVEMNNGVNNNQFTNTNGSQYQNYYNGVPNSTIPNVEYANNGFNNNYTNDNMKNGLKNKKIFLIAIIALMVLIGIFGITMLFGGSSSEKRYTVNIGEELRIKELDGLFDFSIEILSSVEKKHIVKEGIVDNDEYDAYAIKVKVKNYGEGELLLDHAKLAYQLLDSNGNEVETLNPFDAFNFDDAIQSTIASGNTATGYLYFYDLLADENTTEIDVNKVNKLEMGVLHTKNNNGVITGEYESYFIKLK